MSTKEEIDKLEGKIKDLGKILEVDLTEQLQADAGSGDIIFLDSLELFNELSCCIKDGCFVIVHSDNLNWISIPTNFHRISAKFSDERQYLLTQKVQI